ncbi:MAG: chemotaxis response regulator protein-glutamate methylesterase [Candidatus Polarisedimenticolaceae bacterium]|nr:chemotaxis response regulator protein-glutamate methylesterase [Candidatus Polarisedimenticolaceae bacterium]
MNAKIRVLVVDDSSFFRHRIIDILKTEEDIEVVGEASNGAEAVEQAATLLPDVITMDVQMPVMDGITAVRKIMASNPSRIIMFSNVTSHGAKETLQALEAGAIDFLPKQTESKVGGMLFDAAGSRLINQLRIVAKSRIPLVKVARSATPSAPPVRKRALPQKGVTKLIAIGASTGGPVALQKVLASLPSDFSLPLVLAVHMPANFTTAFAERMNECSAIRVREASDRDRLEPGLALLAPGGKQMLVDTRGSVQIVDSLPEQIYHPSVDVLLGSASASYPAAVLGIVLTGMGCDGKQGARLLKASGSAVWSQNKESCVVYGMPQAVEAAGYSDRVMTLEDIGDAMSRLQ